MTVEMNIACVPLCDLLTHHSKELIAVPIGDYDLASWKLQSEGCAVKPKVFPKAVTFDGTLGDVVHSRREENDRSSGEGIDAVLNEKDTVALDTPPALRIIMVVHVTLGSPRLLVVGISAEKRLIDLLPMVDRL